MDYNNHPDTTLAEIHALLDTAQARLEKRLRADWALVERI
jgi:hypothetical protein